jgi:hypothetical protein
MNRFRDPSIDDDRWAEGSDRRERQKVQTCRIVTALVSLDDWAWADICHENYNALTEADVERTAARADLLERLVVACLRGEVA